VPETFSFAKPPSAEPGEPQQRIIAVVKLAFCPEIRLKASTTKGTKVHEGKTSLQVSFVNLRALSGFLIFMVFG